jgi:hypothetical protein
MFEFLKPQQQTVIDDVEATGTYADALLNVPSPELTGVFLRLPCTIRRAAQ